MAKPGEYRYRVDPNGMLYTERYGLRAGGDGEWFYQEGDIPEGMDMTGRMLTVPPVVSNDPAVDTSRANQLRIDSVNKQKEAAKQSAIETWSRGESAVNRRNEAEAMPFWERSKIHAGEFADSMVGGLADLVDSIFDPAGSPHARNTKTAFERASDPNYARFNKRAAERKESDRLTQELKDFSTGAEVLGEVPTYIATGAMGDIFKLGNTIKPGILGKPFNKRMDFDEIPLLPHRKLPPGLEDDPYRRDLMEEIAQLTGLSAAEGGIDPDDSMLWGSASGLTGAGLGRFASGKFENRPDLNTPETRQLLDKAKERYGYNPSPGANTADPRLRTNESGLRNRPDWASAFAQQDRANDMALMNMAADAIGLKLPANSTSISPSLLKNHMDELSVKYQMLEADTRGIYDPKVIAEVQNDIDSLGTSRIDEAAKQDLSSAVKRLDSLVQDPNIFNGANYQKFRKELLEGYQGAVNEGNTPLRVGYQKLMKGLDEGIDTGMRQGLAGSDYVKWKALNEQYAMTSMLKDYGLTPIGTLDSRGLAEHIQRTQQDSMLLTGGKGTPIDDFVDLSQIDYINRHGIQNKDSSALNSTDVETPDKISPREYFLQTPDAGKVSASDKLLQRAYFRYKYPVETGLLNIDPDSSFRMAQIGRAKGQALGVEENMHEGYQSVEDMYEYLRSGDMASDLGRDLFNFRDQ